MGEIGCFLSHYLVWEEVRSCISYFSTFFCECCGEVEVGMYIHCYDW